MDLNLQFSHDGKLFNRSVTVSFRQGRARAAVQATALVQESVSVDGGGKKWRVTGFLEIARFVHVRQECLSVRSAVGRAMEPEPEQF